MATNKNGDKHRSPVHPSSTRYRSNITQNRAGQPRLPSVPPEIPDPEDPSWFPDENPIHGVGPPPPLPSRPPWAPPPQNPTPPEPITPLTPDHILPPDPHGPPYVDIPPFSPYAPPGPPQPMIPPFPPDRGGPLRRPSNLFPAPCPPETPDPGADISPEGQRPPNPRYPPAGRGPTYLSLNPRNTPAGPHNLQETRQSKK